VKNHAIQSHDMSTLFANGNLPSRLRCGCAGHDHQSNSWLRPIQTWLAWSERMDQRASLREIADDPHMLGDLGLTREEALEHANRPFWR
jgi:uncharacterized protein YjiS (DUF1127 family)